MRLTVAVIGAGSWGTTVATIAAHNCPTILWARNPEIAEEINTRRTNSHYLGTSRLSRDLRATASMEEAVGQADVLVMGVPSHGFRATLEQARPFVRAWVPIISLAKGLEQRSLLRMTQVIGEVFQRAEVGSSGLCAQILHSAAPKTQEPLERWEGSVVGTASRGTRVRGEVRPHARRPVPPCRGLRAVAPRQAASRLPVRSARGHRPLRAREGLRCHWSAPVTFFQSSVMSSSGSSASCAGRSSAGTCCRLMRMRVQV